MTALLDRHPDTAHPVLAGVAELHALLDQLHANAGTSLRSADHATLVADLDRAGRRLGALELKILAAVDHAGTARDAGFTGTDAWTARHTNTSRTTAAREVHLATELEHGHNTTAQALDAGLVSPAHAAVILHAADQLPTGVSDQQRATVEAALVEQAQRLNPDQLRRLARRAIETIEPDQAAVDAHENDLIRTEEATARDACSLTFHDNQDGTTTGHFTVPTLAAAVLRKVIETMTAPRRMRNSGSATVPAGPAVPAGSTGDDRSFDWRHRRGLAFAELLEHLPTRAKPEAEPRRRKRTGGAKRGMFGLRHLGDHHGDGDGDGLTPPEISARGNPPLPNAQSASTRLSRLGAWGRRRVPSRTSSAALPLSVCDESAPLPAHAGNELHHRKHYSRGGRTDLEDAVPLCHFHHQRIHDPEFHHLDEPGGTISFRRRT